NMEGVLRMDLPRVNRKKAGFLLLCLLGAGTVLASPERGLALGEGAAFDVRVVLYGSDPDRQGEELGAAHGTAPSRIAWEVRKRTSIQTRLSPTSARLDSPKLAESPFLYWSGRESFDPLSDAEILGLRRFVELGGFVLIDDANPQSGGFAKAARRALGRAFPSQPLVSIPRTHTVYRSFYLVDRPVGRVEGPPTLDGLEFDGRMAVVMTHHDLGGALARDNIGTWEQSVVPGGLAQRETAMRLAVNLVMYALCLDYKDDQVHAPFIMRRRGRR
ncbi:MAG: DUF4159 domain-containing protein, partial [Myxococcales bacterium]|nr:DUF4159 domain-containing protein [Myxococcales bacterium]